MPTGTCNFPQHHGPTAGGPARWIVALIAGALIIACWRTVLVVLAVVVVLAVLGGVTVLLVHRRHEGDAEHARWELERQTAAARQLARQQPAEIHNHVHLHGLTEADVAAAIVTARGEPQPVAAIEQDARPW